MNPVLSLVTGTRNRPQQFQRLLMSIELHTQVEWELVVSDASDVEMCYPDHIRVIPERPRLGCTKGFNRAFREARGEFVLWLNDDCEVTRGYDTAAIAFMEKHPQIGLGALHYSENGGPFHVNSAWGDRDRPGEAIYANFGIISRELGEKVGFFDEEIQMYGCDNSLTFRILLADKGVADIPDARILHHSVQDAERQANQVNRLRDNQTLTRKYMPLRNQWLAAYRRHAIPTGTTPWAHGQRPVAATR